MRETVGGLVVFIAVAEERNFRAAADRLGVTRSAVSQTIRRLEDAMGIALVHRTTRSVGLTEAGERLYGDVAPSIAEMTAALDATRHLGARPRGQLRLTAASIAESFLSGPLLARFVEAQPDVELDILVTDDEIDIVAEGYDAAVRLGELIAQDMIALPVSGDQRQLAVASPGYIERHGAPAHPRELIAHRCSTWRPSPRGAPFRWEFTEEGRDFTVDVKAQVTTNDMGLMVRLALEGAAIGFGMEETFRPHIERGALVPLLEDYCPPFPGFFLYYPSRRNVAPKLRALIDHIREERRRAL
jgi:DNA-binding transcriptional LysR family regulator